MGYHYLEPEVAGGFGEHTILDTSVHPPRVSRLHYQLDGWLGDSILESFPCFIVTEAAKERLQSAGVTGARFDEVEVSTSEQFREIYPGRQLPTFAWLKIDGRPGHDDFGIAEDGRLVASDLAVEVLQETGLSHALLSDFDDGQ